MEFISELAMFLIKAFVIIIAIAAVVGIASRENRRGGRIKVSEINEQFASLRTLLIPHKIRKKMKREETKYESRTFVLDFQGSVMAPEVKNLTKEVDAVLSSGNPARDNVVVRIHSPGGAVTGYGLGASQIQRLRDAGFDVTATVDEVAASGGYLMASVANKIVASRFSIIGSIGVVAQMPNFKQLLDKVGVNYEVMTAGKFKRTLTMVQENTEEAREKFQQDLEMIHAVFKNHVAKHRPDVDIDAVATGEHWLAEDAIKYGLIDEIKTSDELIRDIVQESKSEVLHYQYIQPKPLSKRLQTATANIMSTAFTSVIAKMNDKTSIYR